MVEGTHGRATDPAGAFTENGCLQSDLKEITSRGSPGVPTQNGWPTLLRVDREGGRCWRKSPGFTVKVAVLSGWALGRR